MPPSTIDHHTGAIEIIAGTPPGGGQDRAARALAEALSATEGKVSAVTNVVGRGGGAAWEAVMRRPADGTCIAISSPTLVTNSLHDGREPALEDLTHLAILCAEPLVFVVRSDSEISGAEDLIDVVRREPGNVLAAIATAIGNVNHLAVAAIASHAGTDGRDVAVTAFGSARDAVGAVVDGQATFAVVSAASAIVDIGAGQVRPIAVSAASRPGPPFDNVPVWNDIGVACVFATWRGVIGPVDMPDEVVRSLTTTLAAAVQSEEWMASVERNVWIPSFLPYGPAAEFVQGERDQAREALLALGLLDG